MKKTSLWYKFKQHKPALAGLVFVMSLLFISLSGYLFLPDKSVAANQMQLSLALKPPGFSVNVLETVSKEKNGFWIFSGKEYVNEGIPLDTFWWDKDSCFYKSYSRTGDAPIEVIVRKKDELRINKMTFWLGTDKFGRDQLSRLLLGTRISLSVGFIAVIISLFLGVTMGLLGGYYGGRVDAVVMWLINVVWSLPTLLVVVALSMAIGKGFWQIFVAVGLSMWVELARIVRGQVKSVKEMEYVQAAHVLGFSDYRIMAYHILPNIAGPVIVICASNFASAILLEAGLSFLGLGVQPPMPSWGMMIKEHYGYIVFDAAHLALVPGVAIMLTVMAFNFIGVGLRDAFDVKAG